MSYLKAIFRVQVVLSVNPETSDDSSTLLALCDNKPLVYHREALRLDKTNLCFEISSLEDIELHCVLHPIMPSLSFHHFHSRRPPTSPHRLRAIPVFEHHFIDLKMRFVCIEDTAFINITRLKIPRHLSQMEGHFPFDQFFLSWKRGETFQLKPYMQYPSLA